MWTVNPVTEWVRGKLKRVAVDLLEMRMDLDPTSMSNEEFTKQSTVVREAEAQVRGFVDILKDGFDQLMEDEDE